MFDRRKFAILAALGASAFALCLAVSIRNAESAEVAYALNIKNGHVPANMQLIRVTQGDVVTLQLTADKPSTVHLHGYDIEKRVVPGAVTDLTFTASATGRFQVHLHGAQAESDGHEVVLVTIEVYPR
jgi:FtsP/CotA-like multicopper oxidase with cupredoxin domain